MNDSRSQALTQYIDSAPREPLLEVMDLQKYYEIKRRPFAGASVSVRAVDGVSFSIFPGETLALVGESGCGKSTTGKSIMKLVEPTGGSLKLKGQDITHFTPREMRPIRRQIQMIFQDPYSSLDPRMPAGDLVGEPLDVHRIATGKERRERVADLFDRVGLSPSRMTSYAHEFSGGQRQRLGIARALALNPNLVVCDEPVSALDVSVQAQIINLLMDIQAQQNLAYLFIAHDLAVVQHISHRVAVMYLGRIVEISDTASVMGKALHPYTEALLSAVPLPDPLLKRRERIVLKGDSPSPINPPSGCHFHTRCIYATARCAREAPQLRQVAPQHWVSCHLREPSTENQTTQRQSGPNITNIHPEVVTKDF